MGTSKTPRAGPLVPYIWNNSHWFTCVTRIRPHQYRDIQKGLNVSLNRMFYPGPVERSVLSGIFIVFGTVDISFCCFTLYIVHLHSPKQLTHYKYILTNILLSNLLFDLCAVIICPITVVGHMGAFSISKINLSQNVLYWMLVLHFIAGCMQAFAFLTAFCARLYAVLPSYRRQKVKFMLERVLFVFYLTVPAGFIGLGLAYPDDLELHVKRIISEDSELAPLSQETSVVLFSFDNIIIYLLTLSICTFSMLYLGVFTYVCMTISYYLNHRNSTLSARTLKLQRFLFFGLCAQSSVLLTNFFLPYTLYFMTWIVHLPFEDVISGLPSLIASTHTTITCILTLTLTKPYRDKMKSFFCCFREDERSSTAHSIVPLPSKHAFNIYVSNNHMDRF